jgi:hypothetical protein
MLDVLAFNSIYAPNHDPQRAVLLAKLHSAMEAGRVDDICQLREQSLADSAASVRP